MNGASKEGLLVWERKWVASFWLLSASVLGFLVAWPLATGLAAYNDGLFYPFAANTWGVCRTIVATWQGRLFRPLDILGGGLTDPVSREAGATMLLQAPALLLTVLALACGIRRLMPEQWRLAAPLATLFLAFQTSTSICLWQPDLISQSWCGAVGLWLGMALWSGIRALCQGQAIWRQTLLLLGVCVVGVNIKDAFYGWCLSACVVWGVCLAFRRSDGPKRRSLSWFALGLPILFIPALHASLRLATGGLWKYLAATEAGDRYQFGAGLNLVLNAAYALAGLFCTGPTHYLHLQSGLLWRALPLVAALLAGFVALAPWVLPRVLGFRPPWQPTATLVALILLFTFLGSSAALPTGHMSEVYLAGCQAGSALVVALGVHSAIRLFWSSASPAGPKVKKVGRLTTVVCLVWLAAISVVGLASRARHTRVSWAHSRMLAVQILSHQKALEPQRTPAAIYIPAAGTAGPSYSQIVMPPAQAMCPDVTERWFNVWFPDKQIKIVTSPAPDQLNERDLVLDLSQLPERPAW